MYDDYENDVCNVYIREFLLITISRLKGFKYYIFILTNTCFMPNICLNSATVVFVFLFCYYCYYLAASLLSIPIIILFTLSLSHTLSLSPSLFLSPPLLYYENLRPERFFIRISYNNHTGSDF